MKRPPDGGGVDGIDRLQLDELVGQQLHGPASLALRRRGAGDGDQAGLLGAVELAVLPAGGRAALDGLVQALLHELLADAGDGGGAGLQRLCDPVVGPGVGIGVGLEQDAGAGDQRGLALAGGGQALQLLALLGGQTHHELVFQSHRNPPLS